MKTIVHAEDNAIDAGNYQSMFVLTTLEKYKKLDQSFLKEV